MNLVIAGNGITGLTAARTVRKILPRAKIQIVSNESDYPYARTALMYIFMGHLKERATECYERKFYKDNSLELIRDTALRADTKACTVYLESGRTLPYDALLIATGSTPSLYDWPGQDLEGVQGLYSLQDLKKLEENARSAHHAVIVGGGLIGVELAEMLHSRKIPVSMLVRENSYASHILPPEESELVNFEIRKHSIPLHLGESLKEITGTTRASGVTTVSGREIKCNLVGLTAGVSPNTGFAKASSIDCARGVLVSDLFQTNAPGVFAAGDCAQFKEPGGPGRVEQLWYTGRIQGELAGLQICKMLSGQTPGAPYQPGVWFNSARFFTLDYQAYGTMPKDSKSVLMIDHANQKSIRIACHGASRAVCGFVLMGIRYRHEVCEKWIQEERSLDYVLANLHEANFDPEFSKKYEPLVRTQAKKAGFI